MFQVRFHGRGGQGVVTAAELLSVAAFLEQRHAQAFPSFGSERMGAPVVSFCRIDDKEIRLREPILEPDALVVQDPYKMGYEGMNMLLTKLGGGDVPHDVGLGTKLLTKDNAAEFANDPQVTGK